MKKLFLIAIALILSTAAKSQHVNQDKFPTFDCQYIGGTVTINFEINCESDKEEFYVLRTDSVRYGDYVQYSNVGKLKHSNSHSDIQTSRRENYSFRDEHPLPGRSYYRIFCTGSNMFSEIKTVYNTYSTLGDIGKTSEKESNKMLN